MQENSKDEIQTSIVQAQEKTKDKGSEKMEVLYAKLAELYKTFFNSQEDMDKPMALEHPTFG